MQGPQQQYEAAAHYDVGENLDTAASLSAISITQSLDRDAKLSHMAVSVLMPPTVHGILRQ